MILPLVVLLSIGQTPQPSASVKCERAAQTGRVRCEVEARAPEGEAIRWGDVQIVGTPEFATALRGRAGPREASSRKDDAWQWALALVARTKGEGELTVRVRLVTCTAKACAARSVEAHGAVVVAK